MSHFPSPGDDTIDSRDVLEAMEKLLMLDELDEKEKKLLSQLRELDKEGRQTTEEWELGTTLILESYFPDYAKELAKETCGLRVEWDSATRLHLFPVFNGWDNWPLKWIDWTEATKELEQDYNEVTFGWATYYVMSC